MNTRFVILFGLLILVILFTPSVIAAPINFTEWMVNGDSWIANNGTHFLMKWNATGTHYWTVPSNVTMVEYLVVAGGASGGYNIGGGGGAGGVLENSATGNFPVSGTITIIVGEGAYPRTSAGAGNDGNFSSFSTINATGGGGGGSSWVGGNEPNGRDGGSGGGASMRNTGDGTSLGGTSTQGRPGGECTEYGGAGAYSTAGGGGYTAVGGNGDGSANTPGDGGTGYTSYITGVATKYAGGGGGMAADEGADGNDYGGGKGGSNNAIGGSAGVNSTGGGGGGGGQGGFINGYAGGSGVVIIKYAPSPSVDFITTPQISSQYGMKVYFTEDSDFAVVQGSNWTFGDGYTSTERNPMHIYAVAGKYTVNLTVINNSVSYTASKIENVNLTADFDEHVRTRMHMNGTDKGSVFTDEAGIAWNVTSVTTSSDQKRFGTTSGNFSDAQSNLLTPSNPVFNISTVDTSNFTVEGWFYPTATGTNNIIVSRTSADAPTVADGWGIYHGSGAASNDWHWWMGDQATGSTSAFELPLNSWSYLVIEGINGNVSVYRNGTYITSKVYSGNFDTINPLIYGDLDSNTTSFIGYMDETTISTVERFDGEHSPPYAEYRGVLETIYPDINPDSTFRFKTDSGGYAPIYNQTSEGIRNRTIQIQNIENTTYIIGTITYQPEYLQFKQFFPNSSTFSGISVVSSTNDPVAGTATFNITRTGGFSTGASRASIIDAQFLYYSYANPNEYERDFFGSGYLINGSTFKTYPVHNFIETQLTFGDWGEFIIDFSANKTLVPLGSNIEFTGTVTNYPNRFYWDWGDMTNETMQNNIANHTYASTGNYSVTLKTYLVQNSSVTNETTKIDYIMVHSTDPPVANFTANVTETTIPTVVQFTDISTGYNITGWNWSFGDGSYSEAQNPIHTYSGAGTYDVSLTATNDYGDDTETKLGYITAHAEAVADFSISDQYGIVPLTTTFADTSTGYGIYEWSWDFGEGNTSVLQNPPPHVYSSPGTYTVNLTIHNDRGYKSKTQDVVVRTFVVDFSAVPSSGVAPLVVIFTDLTSGSIVDTYDWDFGDGNTSAVANPTNTFYTGGVTYHVQLTATNGTTSRSKTRDVDVFTSPPTVDFNIYYVNNSDGGALWLLSNLNATKGQILTFNATAGGAITYEWDYGDGFTDYGNDVVHRYGFGTAGHSLMLKNGWTKVTVKVNTSDAVASSYASKVVNLTTAMESIVFVSETIAPLNESYASGFIAVIGGNSSVPAGWIGIDWLSGITWVENVYVSALGATLFFILLFSIPFIMQWIISKDFVVAGIMGGIIGVWMISRLPANMKLLAVTFIAMSIVAIIYSLLKERM